MFTTNKTMLYGVLSFTSHAIHTPSHYAITLTHSSSHTHRRKSGSTSGGGGLSLWGQVLDGGSGGGVFDGFLLAASQEVGQVILTLPYTFSLVGKWRERERDKHRDRDREIETEIERERDILLDGRDVSCLTVEDILVCRRTLTPYTLGMCWVGFPLSLPLLQA